MIYDFKTHQWWYHGIAYSRPLEALRANDPRQG